MVRSSAHIAAGSLAFALVVSVGLVNCVSPSDEEETSESTDAVTVARFEAESATFTRGRVEADSTASGGQRLSLYWNADVTKTVSLGSAVDTIAIRTRGSQCQGAPQLQVWVDNVRRATLSVSATSWTVYRVGAALAAGSHAVRLTFANDAYYTISSSDGGGDGGTTTTTCDRNLYLDYVQLESGANQDGGSGEGGACPLGQTACNGACVNLSTSANNCGACGRVCSAGQTCSSGVCTGSFSDAGDSGGVCPLGQTACSGACVNLSTSANNCGACGRVCSAGQTCSSGVCTGSSSDGGVSGDGGSGCPAGTTSCGGSCVNLSSSFSNCGACGRVCSAGQTCSSGVCWTSSPDGGF